MLILVFLLLAMATPASAFTQAEIQAYLDAQWTAHQSTFNSEANSGVALTYYGFSYALIGWNSAHDAFGGTTYIERVLNYAETMVSKATNTDNCPSPGPYKSWSGPYSGTGPTYPCTFTNTGNLLDEVQGARELARMVDIIKSDTSPGGLNAVYGTRANAVRTFIHTHIVQKHMIGRVQESNITNFLDNTRRYVSVLVSLDHSGLANTNIRSGLTYRQFIITLLNKYMDSISAPTTPINIAAAGAELHQYKGYTGTSHCGYSPNTVSPCSEDTSHGNVWPVSLQRAVDAGLSTLVKLTPTGSTLAQHVVKLERLFSNIIWDRSTTVPRFTNYIDGGNAWYRDIDPWRNGFISFGWGAIAHHHADGVAAMSAMLSCVQADCGSTSRHYNVSSPDTRTGLAGTTAVAQARLNAVPPIQPPFTVNAPSSVRASVADRPVVGSPAAVTDRPAVSRPTP